MRSLRRPSLRFELRRRLRNSNLEALSSRHPICEHSPHKFGERCLTSVGVRFEKHGTRRLSSHQVFADGPVVPSPEPARVHLHVTSERVTLEYINACTYGEGLILLTDPVRLFKALGDESRLRIVHALAKETFCVCDLAKELGISQPTLSHHLKILRDTGLVKGEKDGQWIYCSLNTQLFEAYGVDVERLVAAYSKEVV